jgi:hypothetical protein
LPVAGGSQNDGARASENNQRSAQIHAFSLLPVEQEVVHGVARHAARARGVINAALINDMHAASCLVVRDEV